MTFTRQVLLAGLVGVSTHALAAGSLIRVACDGASAGAEITVNGVLKGECPLDMQPVTCLQQTGAFATPIRMYWREPSGCFLMADRT